MPIIVFYTRFIARFVRHYTTSPAALVLALKRATTVLLSDGLRGLTARLHRAERLLLSQGNEYQRWIEHYDTVTEADKEAIRQRMQSLPLRPLISVIMPVYNTPEVFLRKAIESVRGQIYDRWELCIADDCSTAKHVRKLLDYFTILDPRIRVRFRTTNGGIAEASNSALCIASGEFVALIDHDDELAPHALALVAESIAVQPDVDLIYSDEDKVDAEGRRFEPYFKSEWNPSLILSQNFFSHLGVYRRSLVEKVGRFRVELEGSQDYDLVLRCADASDSSRIRHIPRVLYHWRATAGSTALNSDIKPNAWNAGARAIEQHLRRRDISGQVTRNCGIYYQVNYSPPRNMPKVSIIIPSAGQKNLLQPCLTALFDRTTYPNFEVLIAVSDHSFQKIEQAAYLHELERTNNVRILVYQNRDFNYSWTNNWAARQATGSILCLMNDDVGIITADWLEKFISRLQLENVGAVGAMLYYPDGTIQHAGITLGLGGVAGHTFINLPRGTTGYFGRAALEQDLSCVTAACMAVRREAFEEVQGFNEELAVAFNDVDLCIRLREKGWRIIWTPQVEHYHRKSISVGQHDSLKRANQFNEEVMLMRKLWGSKLDTDPFYNPNLSLRDHNIRLAFPPRILKLLIS